jgi:hypothetical protein
MLQGVSGSWLQCCVRVLWRIGRAWRCGTDPHTPWSGGPYFLFSRASEGTGFPQNPHS